MPSVGHLGRDPVDHLAPELGRHAAVEFRLRERTELGPGRDAASGPRFGPPQPLDVLLRQHHRGIEADHRETPGHRDDRLDDRLADLRLEEVELCGVVPREARAVVAVVHVADVAAVPVEALERHRRVGVVPVVILEHDPDPRIVREIGARVRVRVVGRLGERQEPVGVLHHPARVDAHVVGHHVARKPDTARPCSVAKRFIGAFAAEVVRDAVVVQGICGSHRVQVAAPALDLLGRLRSLPQPDQPQPGDAPAGKRVELLVGDGVERPDVAPVRA
jgi:hypothetical protein